MIDLSEVFAQNLAREYNGLGDQWDRKFSEGIAELRAYPERRASLRREIDDRNAWVLLGFAQRFAVWAVRANDVTPLIYAFVALSFAGPGVIDDREVERIRALVFRSAEILGVSSEGLVRQAAKMADETGGEWLLAKLQPHATPADMAFREIGNGETFRYENELGSEDPYEVLGDFMDDEQ